MYPYVLGPVSGELVAENITKEATSGEGRFCDPRPTTQMRAIRAPLDKHLHYICKDRAPLDSESKKQGRFNKARALPWAGVVP